MIDALLLIDVRRMRRLRGDLARTIPPEWRLLSKIFTALGDEHRQRILLLFEPGERLNVSQIVSVSTLARSTVSHHLKTLREAGVLASEKTGKNVYFWINTASFRQSLQAVLSSLDEST